MIALLRLAGCTCELPLLRHALDETRTLNDGPRCKLCGNQVLLMEPTPEQVDERKVRQHLALKKLIQMHPDLLDHFQGIGDCYAGCGCDEERTS